MSLALLQRLGDSVVRSVTALGSFSVFTLQVAKTSRRLPFRIRRCLDELYNVGVLSLAIVCVSGTAVGMVLVDTDGRFTSVNQSFCEMVGYSEQELLGRSYRDLTHPDDLALSTERFREVLEQERASFSMEKRCLRKDGSVLWAHTSVAAVLDVAGRPISCVIEAQDILIRAAEHLMVSTDLDNPFTRTNISAEDLET